MEPLHKANLLRGCDFFDRLLFLLIRSAGFQLLHKTVILPAPAWRGSVAPRKSWITTGLERGVEGSPRALLADAFHAVPATNSN